MKTAYCFELKKTYDALFFKQRDDAYSLHYLCPVCNVKLYPCAMSEGYTKNPYFKIDSKNPHDSECKYFMPKNSEEIEDGKGKAAAIPKIPTHFVIQTENKIEDTETKPSFVGTEKTYKASPTNLSKTKNLKESDFYKIVRAYIENPFDRNSKLTILNQTKTYNEYFLEAELAFLNLDMISVYRGKLSFKTKQLNFNTDELTLKLHNKHNNAQISIRFEKNDANKSFFENLIHERDKCVSYAIDNREKNPHHFAYIFVLGSVKQNNPTEISVIQNYAFINYLEESVFKTAK